MTMTTTGSDTTPTTQPDDTGTPQRTLNLKPQQRQAIDFMTSRPSAGIWLDMGMGKTLSTLMALHRIRPTGHILVIAPVAIARSTWLDEIEEWQLPIRTKSLIVDENDKKLSKHKRLEAFAQVFADPPTMYFVNRELLTQTSQTVNLLAPAPGLQMPAPGQQFSPLALRALDVLTSTGPLTPDELVQTCRDRDVAAGEKPTAKTKLVAAIRELTTAGLVLREPHACRDCGGDGCHQCCFGLVDQMPVKPIAGPDGKTRDTIIWPFQTVIIDESQGFKSHSSNRFKALARVRPAISRVIELTGTPSPEGLHDLWAQIYLLDQGQALGTSITAFRNRWFTPKMVPGTNTPASWLPNSGAEQEIYDAISHLVMSAHNTNLVLPPVTVDDVHVRLTPDLLQAYKDFKRELVLEIVDEAAMTQARTVYDTWLKTSADREATVIRDHLATLTGPELSSAYAKYRAARIKEFLQAPDQQLVHAVVAQNQAVLTSKLMQFASGTLYTADPDDPATKGRYEVLHDAKIEMTEYLIRNNGGSPVLLAYHFKSDKEQLLTRLNKAGIKAEAFDGSRSMIARWNAGAIPVMLVHPASAGHGLNLQHGGHTLIWFTLPSRLEHYLQANARLHRPGQTQPVTIHRLITKGTHDERMPSVLMSKKDTQDRLLQAVDIEGALLSELEDELNSDLNDLWRSERM